MPKLLVGVTSSWRRCSGSPHAPIPAWPRRRCPQAAAGSAARENQNEKKKIKIKKKKKKKAAGWDHPVAWEGDLAPGFWGESKSSQSPALEGGGVPVPPPAGRGKPELLVGSGGGIRELDGLAAAGVGASSWPSATVTAPLSESLFSRSSFDSNTNT